MAKRKAMSPEAREDQLINLAINLAEKQLQEGTASAQVITHYLKLASTKERLEREMMEKQMKLVDAKVEAIVSGKESAERYEAAIRAMRSYQGLGEQDSEDYDENVY